MLSQQEITVKKYFSLAAKRLFVTIGFLLFNLNGLHADGYISGIELRDELNNYLAEQGLIGRPALDKARQFRACSTGLQMSPLFGSFQTIEIRCPDNDGWKIAVRTRLGTVTSPNKGRQVQVPTPNLEDKQIAVVVNKRLTKNSIIGPGDVSLEPFTAISSKDFFTRIDDVVGRRLKRSLHTRQLVEARHLKTNWMIEKGQPVILESGFGAIQVLSEGIALDNAQWGELARFLNTRSDKEVFGKVVSEKKVVIRTKTSQK
ncbi:MAG: flagella basal body P-ring formation protein FlgA [Rhodospirillaceae bacterium]|nr:flagella basal body P-ring formation protein FlgA [Rhodospirillaceae bacterium]